MPSADDRRATAAARVAAGVVRLGPADAGEVLTLQLAAWVSEARANGTVEIPPLRDTVADVRAQLGDPDVTAWGLREGGRLLATVRTSPIGPDTAFLARLGVVPDLTRQGLGGAMLRLAEARLPAAVRRVELVTGLLSTENQVFYARHGYELVARLPEAGVMRLARTLPPRAEPPA